MALAMLSNKSPRLPLRQFTPTARLKNEAAFALEWPNDQELAIQACAQRMKICRCPRRFSLANNFRRIHLSALR